jgi:hypothetical protein
MLSVSRIEIDVRELTIVQALDSASLKSGAFSERVSCWIDADGLSSV